jgi:MFS family permease
MQTILRQPGMKLVFLANFVSMVGSGITSAGVTWYVLQRTGSEMALGWLVFLMAVPALVVVPLSGVFIDRHDRRHVVLWLDLGRGLFILMVAIMALRGAVDVWHLYVMNMLVTAGFWLFWPTITALIQELTPESEIVSANSVLLASVQAGWLLAGAIVGFVYNHIGLAGVLFIDVITYAISFTCYLFVREGRVVVKPENERQHSSNVAQYFHEMREALQYMKSRPAILLLGIGLALFNAAMLTAQVINAPLSDHVLNSGAVGFGYLNAGWAVGAVAAAIYAPKIIGKLRETPSVAWALGVLALTVALLPFNRVLAVAVAMFFVMGSARGVGGVGIQSGIMRAVPKHFMGRVQNPFYFLGTLLQMGSSLLTGVLAQKFGLAAGFAVVSAMYLIAALMAVWSARHPEGLIREIS